MEKSKYRIFSGTPCYCRRGLERDNCTLCEGTGQRLDFTAMRAQKAAPAEAMPRTAWDCLPGAAK